MSSKMMMSSTNNMGGGLGPFGDTTYTKVFVGGLAWKTQKETMKKYFEQFGEIFEAVVILDKNTRRSKGYGFVTFKEAEAARKACMDPAPVIDGRKANCNLASLGVQRSGPSTPQHAYGGGSRNSRAEGKYFSSGYQGGVGAFPCTPTLPYHAVQQGIPYILYGNSPNYTYPMACYSVREATSNHHLVYGTVANGSTAAASANSTKYWQHGQGFYYQYFPPHHFQSPNIASSSGLPHAPSSVNAIPQYSQAGGAIVSTAARAAPSVHARSPHYPATESLRPISDI